MEIAGKAAGSHAFRVEEFVPERMKVEARSPKPQYLLGEEVPVGVEARYLFGGVPAGARWSSAASWRPPTFTPKQNANFAYGVWREARQGAREGGAAGRRRRASWTRRARRRSPAPRVPQRRQLPRPRHASSPAPRVFEAGSGRTTVGEASVPGAPGALLRRPLVEREEGEAPAPSSSCRAWSSTGTASLVADVASVDLELVRLEEEYGYYYDENLGEESWRRYLRPVPEDRTQGEGRRRPLHRRSGARRPTPRASWCGRTPAPRTPTSSSRATAAGTTGRPRRARRRARRAPTARRGSPSPCPTRRRWAGRSR